MYVIDGIFLTRQTTGLQRFAANIVRELDALAGKGELRILVPEEYDGTAGYKNIEIIRYGRHRGYLWEQTDLPRYLRKSGAKGIFLENDIPVFYRKGIVALHDISLKVNPQFFSGSFKSRMTRAFWQMIYGRIMTSDMKIVTVSEFSKAEIKRVYGINDDRITVINNAWQHMDRIASDDSVLSGLGLKEGAYWFGMATSAPNKNLKWITEAARQHGDETFVIAGSRTGELGGETAPENLKPVGYVSDGEARALMAGCKGFLFPTFYEGFGLPPMEALAAGAGQIVVSDTPCMHEVYGDVAQYIDPHDYRNIELHERRRSREEIEAFLEGYSWKNSAEKFMQLIREEDGNKG